MVPQAWHSAGADARLDDDEIDAQWKARQRSSAREPILEDPPDRGPQVRALPKRHGLFREPERPARSAANLDDAALLADVTEGLELELAPTEVIAG